MKKHFQFSLRLLSLALGTCLIAMGCFWVVAGPSLAQEAKLTVRGSGLPVPRYVTLKFNEVNMRAGPGREYPVLWSYSKTGLPLLVEAEFGVWRKVVDQEGTTGWMRGRYFHCAVWRWSLMDQQKYMTARMRTAMSSPLPREMLFWNCKPAHPACVRWQRTTCGDG